MIQCRLAWGVHDAEHWPAMTRFGLEVARIGVICGASACPERDEDVIDAFYDLADTIITVRSLIRQAWVTHRWDTRPQHRR
jgi:hypothetical protein